MSKKLTRSIAATAAALLMATQAMAFSASAISDTYYYYNGIYYSDASDATAAAGGNAAAWESVPYAKVASSGAMLKYYDSVTKKYYDSADSAKTAGVKNPSEIYVGSYYVNNNYYVSGTGYYCSLNGKYYTNYIDALSAAGGQAKYVTYVGSNAVANRYYSSYTGLYYSTYQAALNASRGDSSYVTYMGGDYWYGYYGKYYSSYTGKYYNNYTDAVNASKGNSAYVTYVGGYYNDYYNNYYGYYYSSYTGKYYTSYSAAVNASNGNSAYVTAVGQLYTNNNNSALVNGSIYKYYYNGVSYPSLQAAKDAGGTVGVNIYYTPYGNSDRVGYYYYYNGTYYGTLDAAKKAGGTALGTDITYVPYNYYGNANLNYYGYFGKYGYIDPYYTLRDDLKKDNVTSSTKEAEDGEPYIYGNKKRAGWSTVIKYINAASKGDNIKVDMNGASTISKDVLKALDGKNVSVTFVLDNGVKWTVNGKDVDTAQDMLIYTKYNIDYIPEKLVNKASKDAVSKAQIGISNDFSSFGSEASVTVRFSDKRAGCVAVVYRYDSDSNSLKGVDKAKVQSDGSCTFSVTAGGPYLIVLK